MDNPVQPATPIFSYSIKECVEAYTDKPQALPLALSMYVTACFTCAREDKRIGFSVNFNENEEQGIPFVRKILEDFSRLTKIEVEFSDTQLLEGERDGAYALLVKFKDRQNA